MMAYRYAMFLVLLGGVVGGYNWAATFMDHSWFPGADTQMGGVNNSAYGEVYKQNMSLSSTLPSQTVQNNMVTGAISWGWSLLMFAWYVFKGVFFVSSYITAVIVVPDPNFVYDVLRPDLKPSNLFTPIAMIIQVGIWVVYWIGFVQYQNKTPLKGAY